MSSPYPKLRLISFTDVYWLFKALNKGIEGLEDNETPDFRKTKKNKTGIDASKAKGSHKKGYLNLGEDMKKAVLTLTNSSYLKEYHIKQLRNAFLKAGVFPNAPDIIEQLKKMKEELLEED